MTRVNYGLAECRLTGRRGRKGFAEGAEKFNKKVFNSSLSFSFATSAKPQRPLRPEVLPPP